MSVEAMAELVEAYIKTHPEVARALDVFRMSSEEYRRLLFAPKRSTSNTTNYGESASEC